MSASGLSKTSLIALLDGLQDLVYVTDADRRIVFANTAFAAIFRYPTKEAILGQPISAMYVEPAHRDLLERSMRSRRGRLINYFVFVRRATGEPFCLSVDSNWVGGDEHIGIEGTGRDLTGMVGFLGPFFQADAQGTITFCSPSFAKQFVDEGPQALIGTHLSTVLVDGAGFLHSCTGATGTATDCGILRARGRGGLGAPTFPVRAAVAPIQQEVDGENAIVGYQGTLVDVTEMEAAREELHEQNRILELLMSQSIDGIYVIQGESLVLVNDTFCTLAGRRREELLQRPYLCLVHPDDQARVADEVRRKLSGESREPYRFRLVTGSGSLRIVRAASGPCTMRGIASLYGYLRDVTEEVRREDELTRRIDERTETLNAALEYQKTLLDTVVHEMDAPTAAIRGITERLQKGIGRESMNVQRQLRKLSDIDELCQLIFMLQKNVSLAEASELIAEREAGYWLLERDILDRAVNFLKPMLRNRDLPLDRTRIFVRGAPRYVRVNHELFQQMFFNLLANAVKYAPPNPDDFRVEIHGEYSRHEGLLLQVRDWGIGIPKGEEMLIFEKRKKGSNAAGKPGMGLGLWVAKLILEASRCKIWVEHLANPTTFSLQIPASLLFDEKPAPEVV